MKKFLSAIVIIMCAIFLVACNRGGLSGDTVKDINVYATDLHIENTSKVCLVGDTFLLNENIFTIKPANATVKPVISISSKDVLSYDSSTNVVTCLKEGSSVIKISVAINESSTMEKSMTVTVIPRPIDVESLSVELEKVYISNGNVQRNLLSIFPNNCQHQIEITYSTEGIVSYDGYYIRALNLGNVKVTCKDAYTNKSVSFDVCVVPYGTLIPITTDKYEYWLVPGDEGQIKSEPDPQKAGCVRTFKSSDNDVLTIDNDGNYKAKSCGVVDVTICYDSGSGHGEKTVRVYVINEVTEISATLTLNGTPVTHVFADASLKYILKISADEDLYDDIGYIPMVIVNNQNIFAAANEVNVRQLKRTNSKVVEYEISFLRAGSFNISAVYTNRNNGGQIITCADIDVESYDVLKEISYSFVVDGEEIKKPQSADYELVLINKQNLGETTNIPYEGILNITTVGTLYNDGYTYKIVDSNGDVSNGITYDATTGKVTAVSVGRYFIELTSTDAKATKFNIPFNVTTIDATDIKNGESSLPSSVTLYFEGQGNDYPTHVDVNPVALPVYAYDTNVKVSVVDDKVVSYNSGRISATGVGSTKVIFSCGSATKEISVTVKNFVKDLSLDSLTSSLHDSVTTHNTSSPSITVVKGSTISLSVSAMVSGFAEYDQFTFEYFDKEHNAIFNKNAGTFYKDLVLTTTAVGTNKIIIKTSHYSDLSIVINVTVVNYVAITSATFSENSMVINTATTTDRTFNVAATITPSTGYHDVVTYASSNTNVATVNNSGVVSLTSGVTTGSVAISVYVNGTLKDTLNISFVYNIPVTTISFQHSEITVDVGEEVENTLTILPTNHTSTITFTSSDETVATVSSTGAITVKSAGETTISVLVDGEVKDSYTLTVEETILMTADDLIAALNANEDITLTNDITLPNSFTTISSYSGVLDGDGYTISNLRTTFVATNNGEIKNVTFTATVNSTNMTGAVICGTNSVGAKLTNVNVGGTVALSTSGMAGMVGTNKGEVSGCNVNLTVTGSATAMRFAGFVYNNEGTISSCNVSGNISGVKTLAGFIYNFASGSITNCKVKNLTIDVCTEANSTTAGFIMTANGETVRTLSGCSAEVTYGGGNSTSKIGGFVYTYMAGGMTFTNCTSKVIKDTTNSLNTNNIGLFVGKNNSDVTEINGSGNGYYALSGYNAIYDSASGDFENLNVL